MTETLRYQGLFQSMGENVGIGESYSAIMSETMTKLTYDLASLYNKTEQSTAEALRAGVYAGQTKPLRGFGIDVTQTSLTPVLADLGIIDRSISQMSQAEKEVLRYIATLRQASVAMGDFADTIESPANQLKVFKNQLAEAKVAISNLFMGLYANILPYANAILMVIKEVAQAIAGIFGLDTKDYNTGLSSTEEIYSDIEEGATGATKAVKELKRQTLKFDEINNLTTQNSSGSGGGSGSSSSGIDPRLLEAITGYDNMMGNVRMKATEIRDRIMEWLGFTKEVDSSTGEVNFKLKDGYSNFKLIVGLVGTLIGYKLIKGITGIVTGTSELAKILGSGGIFKGLKNIVEYSKYIRN